ncbi:Zn-dependent alcohol dehydrogenase [Nocardioides marmoriginsengisoli]|uniref:Zn-dependent alcohol dehydrogenase n=1 Tax=Nocardioides marmoriginsengisoli TaxID=661483 RepID=A0A3N0CHH6_9ACTN|nr:Zn-dependent alcohol dehydrogenase [Nocardioides marmoriginsengisoli]RNL62895.1 Zn-dependent alcohol dehydrogenase [Nocardioides marmoriginsengisoli]
MRAAVLHEHNAPLIIEELELLPLAADEIRVEVTASGVCHSDVMVASGGVPFPLPLILGHEGAGRVLEVGAGVVDLRPGDHVVAAFTPVCGRCFFCVRGQTNLCTFGQELGMVPKGVLADGREVAALTNLGTFADVLTAHRSSLVKVETDLPDEQLALLGCGVTTGVGAALNTANVTAGSTVVVIGCGGVGLSVIQGARIAGAARIFAVDPVEMKRKSALDFGATDVIDPTTEDVIDVVKTATRGLGADFTFEVVGRAETLVQAFDAARPGGDVVLVGFAPVGAQVSLPILQMMVEEKSVRGSNFGSAQFLRDLPRLIALVEGGRLDVDSMISRRIRLDEVNDAFRAMDAGEVIRSVIV